MWTEGKGDMIRRSKEEVTMEGHIPDLSRGWKSSSNTSPEATKIVMNRKIFRKRIIIDC